MREQAIIDEEIPYCKDCEACSTPCTIECIREIAKVECAKECQKKPCYDQDEVKHLSVYENKNGGDGCCKTDGDKTEGGHCDNNLNVCEEDYCKSKDTVMNVNCHDYDKRESDDPCDFDLNGEADCCNSEVIVEDDCCASKPDKFIDLPEDKGATEDHCIDSDCDSCKEGSFKDDNFCEISKSSTADACVKHFEKALDNYYKYIETGQCICRKIFKGLNSCCGTKVSGPSIYHDKDECFGESTSSCTRRKNISPRFHDNTRRRCRRLNCPTGNSLNNCGGAKEEACFSTKVTKFPLKTIVSTEDPESLGSYEQVVLNVTGMTCTGCSRKMRNVLQNINGISSINVTFVTGTAEFTIDKDVLDISTAMSRIAKETGFKLSKNEYKFQTIDIVVNGDPNHVYQALQDHVESIEKLDKTTFRISYDPQCIGSRSIISKIPIAKLAPPKFNKALDEGKKKLYEMSIKCALSLAFTIPVVVLAWSNNSVPYSRKSIVSLVLSTLVQIIAIPEFYVGALKSLIYSKVLEMDMLVVISITAAYVFSLVVFILNRVGVSLSVDEFFETSSLLISLVLVGRFLSAFAKIKAVSSISLRSLQVETTIIQDHDTKEVEIDSRLLEMNDQIIIPPHTRIVTDGIIISGESSVDESMITGESLPVFKEISDKVVAGTINGSGRLVVQVTRLPGKNSITDIAESVEGALAERPKVQELADKVASYFIPVVIFISTIVFVIWIIVGLKIKDQSGGRAVSVAITYGIAVLAISCPCAIGLAVPMVLIIAGGAAAREGIIIKQSSILENAYKVSDVVFDKTGTLTENELVVENFIFVNNTKVSKDDATGLIKHMTANNTHPVSTGVSKYLDPNEGGFVVVEKLTSIPGAGIHCSFKGLEIKLGNPFWTNVDQSNAIEPLISQGLTLLCLTVDSELIAVFSLKTELKPEAKEVVNKLTEKGTSCHIVSGDHSKAVKMVASELGIDFSNMISRATPKSKQDYIKSLKSKGKIVLFCGDGTNDAIAIAQADIGVQIGTTSEVTKASSDVILLGGLDGILKLQNLSKRTFNRIAFNFIWSAIYNLFAILLSAGAFVKFRIPPAYSGIGEIVSIAPVIAAALSLSFKRKDSY